MAESSSQPAAPTNLLIGRSKEEPSLSKVTNVTMTTGGSDQGAKVPNSSSKADRPLPTRAPEEDEEATPTPPESSPSLSENETLTIATTEDETLSVQLRHIKAESGPGREGESDGVTTTGNSLDIEDGLSSTYSAPGVEGSSPSVEAPGVKADEALEAAAPGATEPGPSMPAYYLVKWITWKEKKTPIITQSENGPCPLLAIMNTLFLRWKNMSDAMAVLPKLSTGLDVNVRFTGVTDFEYTPECIVFDLLNIPLYHGWLVDPQSPEMVAAVGKLSYNQLVEKIIDCKHSADSSRVSEGLVAEQFLESTATQLSYHGLCELNTTAKEGEISVFFRNNHFSTMIKYKGFLQEESMVWESLHNVEGDGNFCNSDFRLCLPPERSPAITHLPASSQEQQRQIDQVPTPADRICQ
ncbi:Ubiquitin carboxyl-terminal hydrolase MINDY-1 [Goodea atripinnis]|uniref:Ubiquitin carboxyl-terminal hydrolase n=1 Tax=Goodea atripinnis TaxID=208336 RepID=A0ABV0N192_9TELE